MRRGALRPGLPEAVEWSDSAELGEGAAVKNNDLDQIKRAVDRLTISQYILMLVLIAHAVIVKAFVK
jgi:hypothetical protein